MPFNLFEYHTMGLSPMPGYDRPAVAPRRFSFNFPSGKKWTLSKADDARAREFYCGGGPVVEPPPPPSPQQPPPIQVFQPPMRNSRTGALFCNTGYVLQGDKCYPQPSPVFNLLDPALTRYGQGVEPPYGLGPKMVCGGYLGWDGSRVFTEPNNRGEMIAYYTGGRCSPIFGGVRTGLPIR